MELQRETQVFQCLRRMLVGVRMFLVRYLAKVALAISFLLGLNASPALSQPGINVREALESHAKSFLAKADEESKLALKLVAEGKMAEAISHARQASEHIKTALGDSHVSYAQSLVDLARLTAKANNATLTEAYMEQAIEASIRVHGEETPPTAELYFMLGDFYRSLGDLAKAKTNHEKGLSIREQTLGPDHFDTTESMLGLARVVDALGYYAQALDLERRCVEIRQRTLPTNATTVVMSRKEFAALLLRNKLFDESIVILKTLPEDYRAAFPDDTNEYCSTLTMLANAYLGAKEPVLAFEPIKKCIETVTLVYGKRSEQVADMLLTMGRAQNAAELYTEAEQSYSEAQGIVEPTVIKSPTLKFDIALERIRNLSQLRPGPENLSICEKLKARAKILFGIRSWQYVQALIHCSVELEHAGKTEEGYKAYSEAIAIAKAWPDEVMRSLMAYNLRNSSGCHLFRSNFSIAERHVQDGLTFIRRDNHEDFYARCELEENLVSILRQQGKDKQAIQLSSEISARRVAHERSFVASGGNQDLFTQNSHALMLQNSEKLDEAEAVFLDALERCEDRDLLDTEIHATLLRNFSLVLREKKKFDKAEECIREALSIQIEMDGEESESAFDCQAVLGVILHEQRNYEEARPLLEKAYTGFRDLLGTDNGYTSATRKSYIVTVEKLGDVALATKLLDEELRSSLRNVQRNVLSMSEPEQTSFFEKNLMPSLIFTTTIAFKNREDEALTRSAVEWLVNGKGRLLESLTNCNLIQRTQSDTRVSQAIQELDTVRRKIATLANTAFNFDEADERAKLLAQLSEKEIFLQQNLRLLSAGRLRGSEDWITYEEFAKSLAPDTAFIDLEAVPDPRYPMGTLLGGKSLRFAAWITYGDLNRKPVCVDICSIESTNKPARKFIDGTYLSAIDYLAPAEKKLQQASALRKDCIPIYQLLWKPLEKHVEGISKLVICPSGPLCYIPWQTIPLPGPKKEFVIDRHEISYVSSGRECVAPPFESKSHFAVVFADPDHDITPLKKKDVLVRLLKGNVNLNEKPEANFVPHSAFGDVARIKEDYELASRIQPLIQKRVGGDVFLFRREEAVETLAKRLDGPRVLMIATHGYSVPADHNMLMQLRLKLPPEKHWLLEDPLLRYGLLLAGCNDKNAYVGGDDGVLTAIEILSMRLEKTELVFLASCYAGGGDMVHPFRGLTGVREAFHRAGARSVIAAQWAIPVAETVMICDKFFEHYAEGDSPAAALRKAQLAIIEKERKEYGDSDPHLWAGLTVTGR